MKWVWYEGMESNMYRWGIFDERKSLYFYYLGKFILFFNIVFKGIVYLLLFLGSFIWKRLISYRSYCAYELYLDWDDRVGVIK